MKRTVQVLATAAVSIALLGVGVTAASAQTPAAGSSSGVTIARTNLNTTNLDKAGLSVDPTNDYESGVLGVPHQILPGHQSIPIAFELNSLGLINTSSRAVVDYEDGAGTTYELTITVGAPTMKDGSEVQTIGVSTFKNGHVERDSTADFSVDTQSFTGYPNAIFG